MSGLERAREPTEQDAELFARLGLGPAGTALRELALTHPSHTRELELPPEACNERLEFLGDAVVQLAISQWLHEHFPDKSEGQLTGLRSFIVRGSQLASAARRLGFGPALRLGRGTAAGGGRVRPSILAGALEAMAAAVYLDHGWEAAREAIVRWLAPEIETATAERLRNWKGELQELTQSLGGQLPSYRLTEASGPPHDPHFTVEVRLGERWLAQGHGASKKLAEQHAARAAWEELHGAAATSCAEATRTEGTPP